jgi:hypothetical protein
MQELQFLNTISNQIVSITEFLNIMTTACSRHDVLGNKVIAKNKKRTAQK